MWKTSYRLVLDDREKPFLQGWAIVENTTPQDWKDVELTLLGGRPVSFEMDLYSPLFTERPTVRTGYAASSAAACLWPESPADRRPVRHAIAAAGRIRLGSATAPRPTMIGGTGGMGGMGGGMGGGFMGGGGPAKTEPVAPDAGIKTAAKTDDAGESFRFVIQSPVTLAQHQSALLPVVNDRVQGDSVAIFNPETMRNIRSPD